MIMKACDMISGYVLGLFRKYYWIYNTGLLQKLHRYSQLVDRNQRCSLAIRPDHRTFSHNCTSDWTTLREEYYSRCKKNRSKEHTKITARRAWALLHV